MRSFVISLVLALLTISPALAQDAPPALVVTLRDESGTGIAEIAVVVTDRSGATVLARGTTGADGSVTFATLLVNEVRVQVSGQLPAGISLRLPGRDADGIAVILGVPAVRVDLRSEADGTVRPDPASISLEPGVPLSDVPFPTARPAATFAPTAPALLTDAPVMVAQAQEPAAPWLGLVLLASLLCGMVGVFLLQLRGRAS
ncbi:MAG TPA: hypothetical protein VN436_13760 [Holophaga sp.]|nr:hypothetical protein [Holophaga sp.]